jgi:VCBS repeat-containing protein
LKNPYLNIYLFSDGTHPEPSKGTVSVDETTGEFTYTPTANANGTDIFYVKAYDGAAYSDSAAITVNITPVNDAPTASDTSITNDEFKTELRER